MTPMRVAGAFILALVCGVSAYFWFRPVAAPLSPDAQHAFFQHYENGRYAEAFAVLPPTLRDWSPYEKDQQQLTPMKRDESVFTDIWKKESGARALPRQHALEKEILYYQGVMHFRMNRLDAAKEKLLKCLQLDPSYRMAHVYLFRILARLESDVMKQNKDPNRSLDSEMQLMFSHFRFFNSEYHLAMAAQLLKLTSNETLSVLRLSLLKEDAAIKNLAAEKIANVANPKSRGVMNEEIDFAKLYRVELVTSQRHCIDEVFFPPEQIMHWDGRNASGRMTGGQKVLTTFTESMVLATGPDAERIIVYSPRGVNVAELRVANR